MMTLSYTHLSVVVKKTETEVMDSKVNATTSKAGLVGSSSSEEIQILTKQIFNIMCMVQGAQNKRGKSKNQGNNYNSGANTHLVLNKSGNQS